MSVIPFKGVFSHQSPENDQQLATSVFVTCHVIVGLGLMTPINYWAAELVFIARWSSGFLVSINKLTDWIFQLQQAQRWWGILVLPPNATGAKILLNYACNYIVVIAMTFWHYHLVITRVFNTHFCCLLPVNSGGWLSLYKVLHVSARCWWFLMEYKCSAQWRMDKQRGKQP